MDVTLFYPYLPVVFAGLMGIAILVYVILDGFDLGVGILFAVAPVEDRDRMIASIGPFWDANETWLVLAIGILLFLAITGLVGLRLVELSLFDGAPRHTGVAAASPHLRADIVDRNGVTLASSFEAYALAARPRDIVGNKEALVARLSEILPERDPAQIRAALYHDGKFRYVTRRILPEQAEAIRRLGDPGLTLEREAERLYPHVGLGAHLVGYTGIDGRGEGGIERAFEERLTAPATRDRSKVIVISKRRSPSRWSGSPSGGRISRATKSRTSPSSKALSSDSMGTPWRTSANWLEAAAPTLFDAL